MNGCACKLFTYQTQKHTRTRTLRHMAKQNPIYSIYHWFKCNRIAILLLIKLVLGACSYVKYTTKLHSGCIAAAAAIVAVFGFFTTFSIRISTKSHEYIYAGTIHVWHANMKHGTYRILVLFLRYFVLDETIHRFTNICLRYILIAMNFRVFINTHSHPRFCVV